MLGIKKRSSIALAVFVAWIWLLDGSAAYGQSELVDAARKNNERTLVWYTAMPSDTAQPLLDAFMKEHPFIGAKMLRNSGEQLMNRIVNETLAGKWAFDVVSSASMGILGDRKILEPYRTPEAKFYPEALRDPNHTWTGVYLLNYVLGFNTNKVSLNEAPKDYPDLLDPKWKNRIIMDPEDYEWYGTLVHAWGRDKARAYLKDLARQGIQWRHGHTLVANLVAAGEGSLGIVYADRVEFIKTKGGPIDWVQSFNPIVSSLHAVGVSRKANSPNAAKLFVNFILSKRGQEMMTKQQRIPARKDVDPVVPKLALDQIKYKPIPTEVLENVKEYGEEFRRIFGL